MASSCKAMVVLVEVREGQGHSGRVLRSRRSTNGRALFQVPDNDRVVVFTSKGSEEFAIWRKGKGLDFDFVEA